MKKIKVGLNDDIRSKKKHVYELGSLQKCEHITE